jgi:hypothetical protein
MIFGRLVEGRRLPLQGCYGFVTFPKPNDYREKTAIWINESGFYAGLLGSRKLECPMAPTAARRREGRPR